MPLDKIVVKGAREHNLKNIDVSIPRDKLVVITGASGSGKSSLAFDTIYAEGQRRYMESLSAYARQFLGRMEKPDVDYIEGLSPSISIDQKGASRNPRSTVGTTTEIYDYLRLLFARAGHPHCPECGREITMQTVEQIVDTVKALPENAKIMVMGPLIKDRKGEHQAIFKELRKSGYARVRIDGGIRELNDDIELDKKKKHRIEVIVDRLVIGHSDTQSRLADSIETALKLGEGTVLVAVIDGPEYMFSEKFACPDCGISLGEIEPRSFSFNSPHGACPDCTGLGVKMEFDPDLVIPNKKLTLAEGAINPYQWQTWYFSQLEDVARRYEFSLNTPVEQLTPEQLEVVLYGEGGEKFKMKNRFGKTREYTAGFEGVIPRLDRLWKDSESEGVRSGIARYMVANPCQTCGGKRLKPEALGVLIDGRHIAEISAMSVVDSLEWVERLAADDTPLSEREVLIARQILKELRSRLGFLKDVGLDYLSVDRGSATLSGGESQRIRLATQIGSGLMGVLYICDEPTVGLHPADDSRLIQTLLRLRDLGNSIIVVEHDEAMMRAADWIVDLGPGSGEHGGHIMVSGPLSEVLECRHSITGQYLSGRKTIPLPAHRRPGIGREMVIRGARQNNLKNIDVHIPLGRLVSITGVSGSGKSTLVNEILFKKMAQAFNGAREKPGDHDGIDGLEYIDKVIAIDQSPIGRTPRSNPATYTGAFTPIRDIFATVPEARVRGYNSGRFSFNVKGGRCEACSGEGFIEIEMQFLPDVTVPCEVCHGQRYSREVLDIRFKGQNIADVLNMTVDHALDFFTNVPSIKNKLKSMHDVGLGYIRLGQPAPTLSGGEAQRIKLATELARRPSGHTLYILDEPTTGLSFDDVAALLKVMQRLVDAGNSVVVIEHQLDIIKNADWIVDLGPGAGHRGGEIVAAGTPEEIAQVKASATGEYLKKVLK
ncbi:MAG: excinuclease ABC subunit UvrA [Dehalogenimonas sp.]|uniref:UvrABC system protein A n=1 Tax=Candidatus Dehalogenimonas loeffleri TaxID=3127115 RepID=A0ABZ2J3A7_9CHLR|nr:excinuclease ABC subunit UvrA [Dehalogenimonas sp.]